MTAWLGGVCRDREISITIEPLVEAYRDRDFFVATDPSVAPTRKVAWSRALGRVTRARNSVAAHAGTAVFSALSRPETHCRDSKTEFSVATENSLS